MPRDEVSKKPVHTINTGPSPGLLRRLLGDPISESTSTRWPALAKAWGGRQIEMPRESAKVTNIGEMGPFTKWRNPEAYAVTGPFGTMRFNRELIEKNKQDLNDVMVHELAHVGQGPLGYLKGIFDPNAQELEPITREAMRKVRKTDISLRGK